MRSTLETMDADAMFDSFDIEELNTMEIADGVALPEMAASSLPVTCCSSSSSSCCCC
ncbi:thiazolylpeptide-type bacteriocin [Streptomyces sp. NPDC098077]|uniref:thiazolylpeptide-type bacteriocin n=1 Tax=unclassified Streptomyces TaxID=2593676 RepID=UPI00325693C6